MKRIAGPVFTTVLIMGAFFLGIVFARQLQDSSRLNNPNNNSGAPATNTPRSDRTVVALASTATLPASTPLATFTPSRTLKPPPTIEPPTATILPSNTPVPSATPTLDLSVDIPGLHGNETATPATQVGCTPRKDWKLEYEVQRGDALASIAQKFNTYVKDLMDGNCMTNPNIIVVGQKIKVPGTALPTVPAVVCTGFEVMTPFDGTSNVAGGDPIVFNWRGPKSPKTLLRITRPDGSKFESVVEIRQNETVDAYKDLWSSGTYKWQLFPLDNNYQQVCPESPLYSFTKATGPTATPTSSVKLGP